MTSPICTRCYQAAGRRPVRLFWPVWWAVVGTGALCEMLLLTHAPVDALVAWITAVVYPGAVLAALVKLALPKGPAWVCGDCGSHEIVDESSPRGMEVRLRRAELES